MRGNVISVLKKSQVQVCGAVRVPAGVAVAPVRAESSASDRPHTARTQAAQARVVEATGEYAVIEVTCGCGEQMQIRCNYGKGANGKG